MCTGLHDFIPATAIAQLELVYLLDGQIVENRVMIQGGDQWLETDLNALADAAIVAVEAHFMPLMSDQCSLSLVRAKDMEVQDSFAVEKEPAAPIFGDDAGGSLPNNVTLTTKFNSGRAGRSFRGRAYNIAIPRSAVATAAINEVTPELAGTYSAAWGNFFTDVITEVDNALRHVVVSYCHNKVWRLVAEITAISYYTTNVTLDSQRRRLPERGQ